MAAPDPAGSQRRTAAGVREQRALKAVPPPVTVPIKRFDWMLLTMAEFLAQLSRAGAEKLRKLRDACGTEVWGVPFFANQHGLTRYSG